MTESEQEQERIEFMRTAAASIHELALIGAKLKLAPDADAKTIRLAAFARLNEQPKPEGYVLTEEQLKTLKRLSRQLESRSDREEMEEILQLVEERDSDNAPAPTAPTSDDPHAAAIFDLHRKRQGFAL